MDYKDKIRKLLALAKSPEPEEAKLAVYSAAKYDETMTAARKRASVMLGL